MASTSTNLGALMVATALTTGMSTAAAITSTSITIHAGNAVFNAKLNDNNTAREFIAALPITLKMTRWGDREYYGKPGLKLSDQSPRRNGFDNGDVAWWPSGGSFAIFFNNKVNPDISDLIVIGKVSSDLTLFDALGEVVEMRIELAR
ncbi:cyclophilin-like fold protein [Rhodoferax sp.]|uniref:cyclophilin-like fold protein n=1 Tax=Rhodoferax sp. TaxID=50421 RepID=UPI002852781B|nr:cyclophilin-like fold protein [Rhodoferax sp.]